MGKQEDELFEAQYKLEKTSVQQQKLEENLDFLSQDLRRSKRNSIIFSILFLLFIATIIGVVFYFLKDEIFSNDPLKKDVQLIRRVENTESTDSLKQELIKLKTEVAGFRKIIATEKDTLNATADTVHLIVNKETSFIEPEEEDTNEKTSKRKLKQIFGYVKRAFEKNGTVFIEVDDVQFYKEEMALKKAKEYKEAEQVINKKGDTFYFWNKNYYIRNENLNTKVLEFDDKLMINGVAQGSKNVSLAFINVIIKDNPFVLIESDNGIIHAITPQELP